MNKRKPKQPTKLPTPLIALVISGALLIAVAIFFALGGSGGGGTPKLVVDQETIDYGDVKFNVEKTFAIKITNIGDGVLRFKEKPYIQVLEGC